MVGKSGEKLKARLGANMAESMGAGVAPAPRPAAARTVPADQVGVRGTGLLKEIELDQIIPDPGQPRKEFPADAHLALVESFKRHGQLQAISVYWPEPNPEGKYRVAWGQRRYEAAIEAGFQTIQAKIENAKTPEEVATLREKQIVENHLRAQLKGIELARAWKDLQTYHGWNDSQLASRFGVTPGMVSRTFALLELPQEVQDQVETKAISPTAAAAIAQLADPELQVEVANRAVSEGLDVAQTKAAVVEASRRDKGTRTKAAGKAGRSRGVVLPAKPKLKPTWSLRTDSKYKVTVEFRKGVEPPQLVAALEHALNAARAAMPA